MSRSGTGRAVIVAAIVVASIAACARIPARRSRPAPARRDTTQVATPRPDTSRRRDTTVAARPDAARRDTTRRDTTGARDTSKAAVRPRRRDTQDPTARCGTVDFSQSPITSHAQSLSDATGKYISFIGGGVVATCSGIKNRLQADSAEYYQVNGMLLLVNNVSYDEPARVHLTSNRLTYYTAEEHIVAEGNVVVTTPSGTTMTGPNADYLREAPALRDRSKLTATGRPTLRVITTPQDRPARAGAAAASPARAAANAKTNSPARDTATIIANTIVDEADSVVYASGTVQIIRTDVTATSDSATYDQGSEIAHLVRQAQIKGTRGRAFTLSGTLIDLFSKERDLTRVVSRGAAHVVSEDLDLKSDTVDLRMNDGRVDRAYAWGPSRATATSPDRDVVADSIEAIMPGQRIRELHALRRAVARSVPDTVRIASKERDVLAGDTIVAHFDSAAAARDTTKNPPVRQIVAGGNAWSLYQIASNEGRAARPGVNYVKGRRITVAFDSGQVSAVTVSDSASGVYLEPSNDSTGADSARARRTRRNTNAPRAGGGTSPVRRPGRPQTSSAPASLLDRDARAERRLAFVARGGVA